MSDLITVARVQQYSENVNFLFQQQGSKLVGTIRIEPIEGKFRFWERVGPTNMVKRTSRHSPTPQVNTQHSRRRSGLSHFSLADLIDKPDQIETAIDIQSAYVVNMAMAAGRELDDTIITAFDADAAEGEDGTTTTSFPAGQQIAVGGAGLTVSKVRETKQILLTNDVPDDGNLWFVASPVGIIEDLLNDSEVTSSDFNTIKALVNGTMAGMSWMGFQWIISTRLPLSGTDRTAFAWHRTAMGATIPDRLSTSIDRRADLNNSIQVFVEASFGAVRILDEGVVSIAYDENV